MWREARATGNGRATKAERIAPVGWERRDEHMHAAPPKPSASHPRRLRSTRAPRLWGRSVVVSTCMLGGGR